MQHLRQHLGGVGEARAGAVEVGVAVGEVDAAVAHGGELGPAGLGLQQRQLFQAALEAIAARAPRRSPRGRRRPARPTASSRNACRPAPNRLWPPAISISSGIQLPPAISGSTHSMKATRGRARPATRAAHGGDAAPASRATSASPASASPRARATRRDVGVDVGDASRASARRSRPAARSRCRWRPRRRRRLTAHTSQWSWVTITSGASAFSASPSTR